MSEWKDISRGYGGPNGEYDWECTQCGYTTWFSRTTNPNKENLACPVCVDVKDKGLKCMNKRITELSNAAYEQSHSILTEKIGKYFSEIFVQEYAKLIASECIDMLDAEATYCDEDNAMCNQRNKTIYDMINIIKTNFGVE